MKLPGTLNEDELAKLSYSERRLINYAIGKKKKIGCCYTHQNKKITSRMVALNKLVEKEIMQIIEIKPNVVYFGMRHRFSKQRKFSIMTAKYFASRGV